MSMIKSTKNIRAMENSEKLISKIIYLAYDLGIIKINFRKLFILKHGTLSPIYFNWREATQNPRLMKMILELFYREVYWKDFDIIMGVASGAIPFSERLAQQMGLPSAYVRPGAKTKDHGLNNLIEGVPSVKDKKIMLIEDVGMTGKSALTDREIILNAGAKEVEIFFLFSYDTMTLLENFGNIEHRSLIKIYDVIKRLKSKISDEEYNELEDFAMNPIHWFENKKE